MILTRARKPISVNDLYRHSKQDSAVFETFLNKMMSLGMIQTVDPNTPSAQPKTADDINLQATPNNNISESVQTEIQNLFKRLEANQEELRTLATEATASEASLNKLKTGEEQTEIDLGLNFELPTDVLDQLDIFTEPPITRSNEQNEPESIPTDISDTPILPSPAEGLTQDARLKQQMMTLQRLRLQVAKQERERQKLLVRRQTQLTEAAAIKAKRQKMFEEQQERLANQRKNLPNNIAARLKAAAEERKKNPK